MKYRAIGAVVGLAVAAGLFYGLAPIVPPHYATAVAVGAGTGAFLVLDGSAGAGEGWIYHQVRSNAGKFQDGARSMGAGVLAGYAVALIADAIQLGSIGASLLVATAALLGANFAFLRRRPNYEKQLEEME